MDHLQTEARNPASANLDELTALQIVQLMNREDAGVISAVSSQAENIALAITIIADRLKNGGRLIYAGAGTSGRLGVLDATECPPTFNSPPEQVIGLIAGGSAALTRSVEGAEDHPEFAERDLETLQLSPKDVVVGIATSGRTPYVLGAANYAKKLRAYRIGLSCNLDSDLSGLVDLAITPVVGPEVLSGSTRLKAGTATKLVLNMLSTGVMILLGKTFGNLMVDLRATNTKLQARTNRIVRILTGLSFEESGQLLQKCRGELKTALVSHLAGLPAEAAQKRLAETGGQVRLALDKELLTPKCSFQTEARADLFLAIDGGGTHTVALLAAKKSDSPDWTIVGRGESGPSNIQAVGTANALNALNEAVAAAFSAAGLERIPVAGGCLGLAGAGRLPDQTLIQDWARRINLATKIKITTDADILLAAGTPDGWGLAIIAGTGSMVYAGAPDGRTARGGGWGYLLGDEGSGYNLVMTGLQAVAWADDDRGPPTGLTKAFLTKMGLQNPQELIPAIYQGSWDRAALAGLAPVVLEAAEAGDPVAGSIVGNEAQLLAETAGAAARKLGLEKTPLPVALAGGLLLGSQSYRQLLVNGLKTCNLQPNPVHLVEEPARGAVRLATALVK
jgi:N-acetylmuramic acid 6-phosphate etherase